MKYFFLAINIFFLSMSATSGESYLSNDVVLDCGASGGSQSRSIDSTGTRHTTYMQKGDTLWVAGNVLAEYQPSSDMYSKELVETYLMCGHNVAPTVNVNYSWVQSRSGVNHWKISGEGSRVVTTHYTKAIYTANESGLHSCWIIYACSPKSGDVMIFRRNQTFLKYYPVNAYPGINWIPEGDHLVDSVNVHTPGGSKIWDAGLSTQDDTEVVVYWSPRMTNCEEGDAQCGSLFDGYDLDTYFDWRIVVYQYNEGNVCNKQFGPWHNQSICKHHDHHCDFKTPGEVFSIVVGGGSEGYCGDNTSYRKFKVYTQMRKNHDSYSDIMIHNSHTARSNFMVYSR